MFDTSKSQLERKVWFTNYSTTHTLRFDRFSVKSLPVDLKPQNRQISSTPGEQWHLETSIHCFKDRGLLFLAKAATINEVLSLLFPVFGEKYHELKSCAK